MDLIRDRQTLYNDLGAGVIENTYHIQVSNKGQQNITVSIRVPDVEYYTYLGPQQLNLEDNATGEAMIRILMHVNHIVFDKKGTLTTESMALEKTIVLGEMDQALCLQLACALESQSEHPVARAFSQALSQNSAQATHLTKV